MFVTGAVVVSGVEAGGGVRGDKEGMSQDGGEGQKARRRKRLVKSMVVSVVRLIGVKRAWKALGTGGGLLVETN